MKKCVRLVISNNSNFVHINLSDKIPSFVKNGCSEGFTPLVICPLLTETVLIVSVFKKCKSVFIANNEPVCILNGVKDTSEFIMHDHMFLYF
jgi:hypothetical protein